MFSYIFLSMVFVTETSKCDWELRFESFFFFSKLENIKRYYYGKGNIFYGSNKYFLYPHPTIPLIIHRFDPVWRLWLVSHVLVVMLLGEWKL